MEAISLCSNLRLDCNSNILSVHVADPRTNELRPLFDGQVAVWRASNLVCAVAESPWHLDIAKSDECADVTGCEMVAKICTPVEPKESQQRDTALTTTVPGWNQDGTRMANLQSLMDRLRPQIIFVAILFVGLEHQACYGQAVHDAGTWMSVNTLGDIHVNSRDEPRFKWWFDGHLRLFDDANGFGQSIVRPAVGYELNENLTFWVGYGWISETPPGGTNFDENRIFQQLLWSRSRRQSKLTSRTRLEQRFVGRGDDTGWRLRQFYKFLRPFEFEPRLSAVVWDEAFFDLNSTDWGQSGGFSQNRVFTGFGWTLERLPQAPRIEIGYMHQYIHRQGADDTHNHIVGINWFARF